MTFDKYSCNMDYTPSFYERLIYKIAKKAKVVVLEISKHKFEP